MPVMRWFVPAALLLAGTGLGCATATEEPDFTCSKRTCVDGGATDGPVSEDSPAEETGTDDTSSPGDTGTPGLDASSDAIFPVDDTALPDTAPVDTGPTCPGAATYCGAAGCKNLATDLLNCGTCGNACPIPANSSAACSASKCIFSCDANYEDCDSTAANGCEAPLLTDENNCGLCGKKCLTSETCTAGVCKSKIVVLETFEPSWPKTPWIAANGTSGGASSAACAHNGTLGYQPAASNPIHYYRSDVTVGAAGTKISVWFKTNGTGLSTSGRVYLGFGANASGTWSLIAAPNTNQLYFERNAPYGTYTSLTTKTRTWATGVWHKLEVSFAAGGVATARVYAADGTTVLDTLTATLAGFTPGGVALRAFHAATCVDTIEL